MIGGDRHDRWAQTNTKLSWTQMFCAQKFFGPGKLFEPKILLDPNFFNPNFFGLLKTRSVFGPMKCSEKQFHFGPNFFVYSKIS